MKFTLARKHTTLRLDNNADFSRLYWAQFLIAWWYQSEEELKGLLMKEENEKVGLNSTFRIRSWHLVPSLHGKIGG